MSPAMVARNRVLLLLNVQEGTLADILLDASAATKVKNNITTILNYARNEVEPPPLIIHVRNAGDVGDIDEPGTPGWQLVHKPLPGERLVDKRRIDAFAGTELGKLIPEDAKIVVVGLQSDLSVRATCGAALNRGDEVLLIRGSHMTSARILPGWFHCHSSLLWYIF